MANLDKNIWRNVELKGHFDTNERIPLDTEITIETPYGAQAVVKVLHRKAQPSNPMGRWRYLVQLARAL